MNPLNVGIFHNIAGEGSAWCCAEGIAVELSRQGNNVKDFKNPRLTPPPIEDLLQLDVIVMGAPEWFYEDIIQNYGDRWRELKAKKVAWYAESAYRDDRNFDFGNFRKLADLHYFPAQQDALEFEGIWLPFGADVNLFKPIKVRKKYEVAFIGSMYPKREEFLLRTGAPIQVIPQTSGTQMESIEKLVSLYNEINIFVNMPAYSRLLVTKVTEVMACGTMLITPEIDHESGRSNMEQFRDGEHLVYYDPRRPDELREKIRFYQGRPEVVKKIARAGHKEIQTKHSLEQRVYGIMDDVRSLIGLRRERGYAGKINQFIDRFRRRLSSGGKI